MKKLMLILISFMLLTLKACDKDGGTGNSKEFIYDFKTDTEGWVGGFADYPNEPNVEAFYELEFSYSALPSPLNMNDGALRQSGKNHSDDLFMFVKKKINGLLPKKTYSVSIEIEIASNAASGSIGVGGAPGESVFIKAGSSTNEPMKVLDNQDNHYRMNIDKGNQRQDGANMKLIGDFANGTDFDTYKLKALKTKTPISVQSNSIGEIWVVVGTDSGYESTTEIYYNSIIVEVK